MTVEELTELIENRLIPTLAGCLAHWGVTRDTAQDIVQITLLHCLVVSRSLREIDNPTWYIIRIAHNALRDHLRETSRMVALEENGVSEKATSRFERTPPPKVDLDAAIALLGDEDRWLINQHYFADVSYSELAKMLGLTTDCLHTRMRRIRLQLRAHLNARIESAADADLRVSRKGVSSDVGNPSRRTSIKVRA